MNINIFFLLDKSIDIGVWTHWAMVIDGTNGYARLF